MRLRPEQKTVFFPFAGMGAAVDGMKRSGWNIQYASAVEILKDRCKTLKVNFPEMLVKEADIADCVLADYGSTYDQQGALVVFVTCPCQKYTVGADIRKVRTGDHLYLEALRDCVLLAPEVIVFENVPGILAPKFKRVTETFRRLRGYHSSQFTVYGHNYSLMRKKRVFYILHRQPFQFSDLREYATIRPQNRLRDYLDEQLDSFVLKSHAYIETRIAGGYKRPPRIFDPDQDEPLPFLYNYGHDRSNYLVKDKRVPGGVRPFSVAEFARLSTVNPDTFKIWGSATSCYHQVADCVYPAVGEAVGRALNEYFEAIPSLYQPEHNFGYQEIISFDVQPAKRGDRPVEPISASPLELWDD